MLKRIKNYFKVSFKSKSNLFILWISLIFSLFNLPQYIIYYSDNYFIIFKAFLLSFFLVYFLFIILSLNKIIFSFFFFLFSFLASIIVYFVVNYNILISSTTVALLFETNYDEAAGVISIYLVLWVTFILILSLITLFLYNKKNINGKKLMGFIPVIILIFPIIYFIVSPTYYFFRFLPMPYSIFSSTLSYVKESFALKKLKVEREKLFDFNVTNSNNDRLKVILIIGEAARAENFQINGYNRETTPNIIERRVIYFKNVLSCATITRIAVPCLMTKADFKDSEKSLKEISIINVFKKSGFYTAWISNQGFLGVNETPVSIIASEADLTLFLNKSGDFGRLKIIDENLIEPMTDILRDKKNEKVFITLHTIGSHWRYDSHYPESFKKFKPVCNENTQSLCKQEEVINSYDNSILYTDYFISRVIDALKDENAIVFYISDHGESLGENGLFSHWDINIDVPEQRRVPFIIWCSEKYKKSLSNNYSNLLKNQKRFNYDLDKDQLLDENKNISHDYIFSTVLGCAGVRSNIIDTNLNLCNF
ncbi:MAG TPA: sulfatase-like hydrolase/transferase [Spirochaetota bacterium]|nr:sulfatase-like hydrolase/transferase [Spirochaetota bacterium]HOM38652.1 sulfatase-like hydrolase/transferase [Spirochaetota bacterium]HPQ49832.1 sulfatase-like hydrolase/transferase [Spirochaetota bacterium]